MPSTPPQNTEQHRESLSAVMDGAVHEIELHRVLGVFERNTELRKQWFRYQIASSVIKKESVVLSDSLKFADAVRAAIENDEGTGRVTTHKAGYRWSYGGGRVLTRLALAASVAMLVIAGAQWQQQYSLDASQKGELADVSPAEPDASTQVVSVPPRTLDWESIFDQSHVTTNTFFTRPLDLENASLETEGVVVPFAKESNQEFPLK